MSDKKKSDPFDIKTFVKKNKKANSNDKTSTNNSHKIPIPKTEEKNYYDILNVSKNATQDEIKKSWKKYILKNHPDRGGTVEKTKELNEAYDILSDKNKRDKYDDIGIAGIKLEKEISQMDPLLYRHNGLIKITDLRLTLEELYNGTEITRNISRTYFCRSCKGNGYLNCIRTDYICIKCNGTGTKTPNSYYDQVEICTECQATGKKVIIDTDKNSIKCKDCTNDSKSKKEKKDILIKIPRGEYGNTQIVIRSEGNEYDYKFKGDILVNIQQIEHPNYRRIMNNLFITINVSLADILCGLDSKITTLDGGIMNLKTKIGTTFSPKLRFTQKNKGMPYKNIDDNEYKFGDMIITFKLEIPSNYFLGNDATKYKKLREILTINKSHVTKSLKETKTTPEKDVYYINESSSGKNISPLSLDDLYSMYNKMPNIYNSETGKCFKQYDNNVEHDDEDLFYDDDLSDDGNDGNDHHSSETSDLEKDGLEALFKLFKSGVKLF